MRIHIVIPSCLELRDSSSFYTVIYLRLVVFPIDSSVVTILFTFFFLFFCRVGIVLPSIEVRYEHLTVEADAYIGSRALPTCTNFMTNLLEVNI